MDNQFSHFSFALVKGVLLQLKPLLTKKKLLVSVAAGVKLKDLEVCESEHFLLYANFIWMGFLSLKIAKPIHDDQYELSTKNIRNSHPLSLPMSFSSLIYDLHGILS